MFLICHTCLRLLSLVYFIYCFTFCVYSRWLLVAARTNSRSAHLFRSQTSIPILVWNWAWDTTVFSSVNFSFLLPFISISKVIYFNLPVSLCSSNAHTYDCSGPAIPPIILPRHSTLPSCKRDRSNHHSRLKQPHSRGGYCSLSGIFSV